MPTLRVFVRRQSPTSKRSESINSFGHMAEAETGGYRESGMGRLHGPEALHDFLETKHIYLEADA